MGCAQRTGSPHVRRGSQERVRRFLDLNLPGGDQADGEPCCLQDAHGGYGSREPSAGALPAAAKVAPQVGTRVMAVFLLLIGSPLAGGCGSGGRQAPTSTEVGHVNVPFSHPSEVYPQKDGRKVRSRSGVLRTGARALRLLVVPAPVSDGPRGGRPRIAAFGAVFGPVPARRRTGPGGGVA